MRREDHERLPEAFDAIESGFLVDGLDLPEDGIFFGERGDLEVSAEALARELGERRLRLITDSDGVCADASEPAREKRHLRRKTWTHHEYIHSDVLRLLPVIVDLFTFYRKKSSPQRRGARGEEKVPVASDSSKPRIFLCVLGVSAVQTLFRITLAQASST